MFARAWCGQPLAQSCQSLSPAVRLFSTSSPVSKLYAHVTRRKLPKSEPLKAGDPSYLLPDAPPQFPIYPYGESHIYKQGDRGLYGGKIIRFGNKISEFYNHTRRSFKPNVNRQTLWSEALNRKLTLKVATSVLRTITKEGGLDNYLIKDTAARVKELGPLGWKLRYLVLQAIEQNAKLELRKQNANPEPVSKTASGTPIYVRYSSQSGTTYNITADRSKLLEELSKALVAPGHQANVATTVRKYRDLSATEIVEKLELNGVDLSSLGATE